MENFTIEMARDYVEVLEIIRTLPADERAKIPKTEIEYFEEYRDRMYKFRIDPNVELSQQNISRGAYALFVILYKKYLATPEEITLIDDVLKLNEEKARRNIDNTIKQEKVINQPTEIMVVKEENFLKRCLRKIKAFFRFKEDWWMARYVFRALNQSDIERLNANHGRGSILAKRPGNARISLYTFIVSGSRIDSRFISMTDYMSIADIKFGSLDPTDKIKRDSRFIVVDLDFLEEKKLHLSTGEECFKHTNSLNGMAIHATESDKEIIYEDEIPEHAYREINPLLVDILTAYDNNLVNAKDTDKICDFIFQGKSEEIIQKLFSGTNPNFIERFFIEKYYGIIVDEQGNAKINPDRNQPLIGDMVGVEQELKKKFNIQARDKEMPEALLGRCILMRYYA